MKGVWVVRGWGIKMASFFWCLKTRHFGTRWFLVPVLVSLLQNPKGYQNGWGIKMADFFEFWKLDVLVAVCFGTRLGAFQSCDISTGGGVFWLFHYVVGIRFVDHPYPLWARRSSGPAKFEWAQREFNRTRKNLTTQMEWQIGWF